MHSGPVDADDADSARRMLAEGDGVRAAFLRLVLDGAEPDAAAKAVCVAAGSSCEETVDRLRQFAGPWDELEPGELADGVDLLVAHGYFEPDVDLDDRQQAALAHLQAALRSAPGIPSGFAVTLNTQLRTGHLVDAHLRLEHLGGRRWPNNTQFWAAMRRAGEILSPKPHQTGPSE